jgi:predicted Zn-dependent protease
MKFFISVFMMLFSFAAYAAPYQQIQEEWDLIKFKHENAPKAVRISEIEKLDKKTDKLLKKYSSSAELWALSGIIKTTKADLYRNWKSFALLQDAKARFEKSIQIDKKAMNAAANSSLAALYYKTPMWPLGFKDYNKAEKLLKDSLTMYPKDVEANYFYADYLIQIGQKEKAKPYFKYAVDYPIRKNRYEADLVRKVKLPEMYSKVYTN